MVDNISYTCHMLPLYLNAQKRALRDKHMNASTHRAYGVEKKMEDVDTFTFKIPLLPCC